MGITGVKEIEHSTIRVSGAASSKLCAKDLIAIIESAASLVSQFRAIA
jgi:hypothetical protein